MAKLRLTIELDVHSLEELESEIQSEIKENDKYKDRSFTHEDILENINLFNHGCLDGFELVHMINEGEVMDSYFFLDRAKIVNKEFVDEEGNVCQK